MVQRLKFTELCDYGRQTMTERDNNSMAWQALSSGRHLEWKRRQLCLILRTCRKSRALPVRCQGSARNPAYPSTGTNRPDLALSPARGAPGQALWLSCLWPL